MTDAEKLEKIREILHEYKDNESVFEQPASETERQKNFREDLRMVVSLVFKQDLDIPSNLSAAGLRERLQKIWKETKPEAWKE
jgi:hypothetical protein